MSLAFALSLSGFMLSLIVTSSILVVIVKPNFFVQVILLEVGLILRCLSSIPSVGSVWIYLIVLCLGAAEGSASLSLVVLLSRKVDLTLISI